MKNLNLNNYGVQEMNAEEMRKVDGGILPLIAIGIAFLIGVIVGVAIADDTHVTISASQN